MERIEVGDLIMCVEHDIKYHAIVVEIDDPLYPYVLINARNFTEVTAYSSLDGLNDDSVSSEHYYRKIGKIKWVEV